MILGRLFFIDEIAQLSQLFICDNFHYDRQHKIMTDLYRHTQGCSCDTAVFIYIYMKGTVSCMGCHNGGFVRLVPMLNVYSMLTVYR